VDEMSRKETEQYYNRVVTAALRIGFVALLFVMADFVLRPFLMMIIWGIIIAIGIYPLFKKLSRLLGGRDKLASALITLTALALIIVPSVFVLVPTVNSVQELAQKAQSDELTVPPPSPEVAKWPVIGQSVYGIWEGAAEDLRATVKTFQPQIREMVTKIAQKITGVGATVLISIFSFIIAGLLLLQAKPAEEVTPELEQAIREGLILGRLPCAVAWAIAARFKMPKLHVANAAEKLGVRVGQCQLSAF